MPCCAPTIIPFQEVSTTEIAYEPALAAQYGADPKVEVWYRLPEDGTYYLSTFGTEVRYGGGVINIDHGGTQTGFVRIS